MAMNLDAQIACQHFDVKPIKESGHDVRVRSYREGFLVYWYATNEKDGRLHEFRYSTKDQQLAYDGGNIEWEPRLFEKLGHSDLNEWTPAEISKLACLFLIQQFLPVIGTGD